MRINQQNVFPQASSFASTSEFKTSVMLLASPITCVHSRINYYFSWPVLASVLSGIPDQIPKFLKYRNPCYYSCVPRDEEFLFPAHLQFSLEWKAFYTWLLFQRSPPNTQQEFSPSTLTLPFLIQISVPWYPPIHNCPGYGGIYSNILISLWMFCVLKIQELS